MAVALGCPSADEATPPAREELATAPSAPVSPEAFRRQAHGRALEALRREAPAVLRMLDPVAAAEVEGTPLRPPGFGASARAERRTALARVERDAAEISGSLLSPADAVVLRVLQTAFEREQQRLRRPPWRDDPRALVHAIEPYLQALRRRLAAGECDDGCGLGQLGPALRDGLGELGSAAVPTVAAAREDLRNLGAALPGWLRGLPPEHAAVTAAAELPTVLRELDQTLARVEAALPEAEPVAWDRPVAPARDGGWKRRPARWDAAQLRRVLEDEEAHGVEPARLFARAEATVARLRAMIERDGAVPGEASPLPRPFDGPACEAAWAPLRAWAEAQGGALVPELDCATALRELPRPSPADPAVVLHLVEHGLVGPSRRAAVAATGVDVALVRGRAAPRAQGLVLAIAITAGSGRRDAERLALDQAHGLACLAATAVWIHGELGPVEALVPRLQAQGCGDVKALVAAAEARPRAALEGLGLVLLGDGPADAAALDRYWWAPMGLVRDLALPPAPPPEVQPSVSIEAVAPDDAASE